jgi:3-dehydro-L-gulonate 2-dehydrogenase
VTVRIPFDDLRLEFRRVLLAAGAPNERAEFVSRVIAENQRDGVYSHGVNRFPGLVAAIKAGRVKPGATPERVREAGAIEQWDGKSGLGVWNAFTSMRRAVELARANGIGCVGLRNTNHWMRGGSYGLQAAQAGCIGLCWTNTIPLLPPWGSDEPRLGNNPLILAAPGPDGTLLLDMAMSQYSNGKLEILRREGKKLDVPGGYDREGRLTNDPGEILESRRALPIGHWKGSGLIVMLDVLAAAVSGGAATHEIGRAAAESNVSQVFIAISAEALGGPAAVAATVRAITQDLHRARPLDPAYPVRHPGEGMLRIRRESVEKGVLVDEAQYAALRGL